MGKMKKYLAIIFVIVMSLSVVSCSKQTEEQTETQKATQNIQSSEYKQETETPTEVPTRATEAPTEKPTSTPTEKMSVETRLQKGYWVEKEGNGIMVFSFDGEKLFSDYYENQNNVYVKIEEPGYSNVCFPEIYEDTFLVYSTGGMTNEFYFTDNPNIAKSYEDAYGYIRTWINYDSIPSVETVNNDF